MNKPLFSLTWIVFFAASTNLFCQSGNLKSVLASASPLYNTYEKFLWDGIDSEWDNNSLVYYTRNSNGTEAIKLTNAWDAANGLYVNSTKETFTYSASGKITIYLLQIWKEVDGILDWTNSSRTVYAYSKSDLLTSVTNYTWKAVNSKDTWAFTDRHLYTYNAQNLKSEDRYQTGKQDTLWEDVTKTLYAYDTKSNNTELTMQDWKSTEWVNNYHHVYKYNASNKMIEDIYQTWDLGLTTPAWENIKKTAYTYDTKSRQTLIYYSAWNKGLIPPVWDTNAKDTITYNSKGWVYVTTKMTGAPGSFTNSSQITNYYDGYGNKTEEVYEDWIAAAWSKTVASRKWIRSYDINLNLTTQITQNWNGAAYQNSLKEDFSGYESYTSELAESNNGVSIYPNPVGETMTIQSIRGSETASVTIADINGRVVLENQAVSLPATLALNGVSSGLYIVTIKTGNNTVIQKIIKE